MSVEDVYLNFGLIAYGPAGEIEKLQRLINRDFKLLKVVYATVTAKRLFLVKKSRLEDDRNVKKRKEETG